MTDKNSPANENKKTTSPRQDAQDKAAKQHDRRARKNAARMPIRGSTRRFRATGRTGEDLETWDHRCNRIDRFLSVFRLEGVEVRSQIEGLARRLLTDSRAPDQTPPAFAWEGNKHV
jgi:hypothetical protein